MHARLHEGPVSSIVRMPNDATVYLRAARGNGQPQYNAGVRRIATRSRYSSAALYFVRLTHACGHVRASRVVLAALVRARWTWEGRAVMIFRRLQRAGHSNCPLAQLGNICRVEKSKRMVNCGTRDWVRANSPALCA